MKVFNEHDLTIISENLELPPRELIPMLKGEYSSRQITALKSYLKRRDAELDRMKQYREKNHEQILVMQKEWRDTNKEYDKERQKRWRENNSSYERERKKKYRYNLKVKYNVPDRWGGRGQALVRGIAQEILQKEAIPEFCFDWLRSEKGYLMPVDMYFPYYNLIIEYNGQQHYHPVDFGCGKEEAVKKFSEQRERDQLKYSLIKSNGVDLIIIPYNFSKKKILNVLTEYLKESDANG